MFKLKMAPPMEQYAQTLGELGFQVTDDNLIRAIIDNTPFDFYHCQSEELNERRKEAVHEAVRILVADELKKHGIIPVHVTDKKASTAQPEEPHVTLMCTAPGKLLSKKDVIVVIGEAGGGSSGQDAGIWAYRSLLGNGGLEQGSAVGLAKMLRAVGKERIPKDKIVSDVGEPGVVILNPGQLLYSYEENKPMTQTSWLGREKKDSLSKAYEVDDDWNKVPAHETANEHIHNVLEQVLPELLHKNARVHMLCIGESVKDTMDCLDFLFYNAPDDKDDKGLVTKLASIALIALIEPNHSQEEMQSPKFRDFLVKHGRTWVDSATADAGKLIAKPGNPLPKHTVKPQKTKLSDGIMALDTKPLKPSGEDDDDNASEATTVRDEEDDDYDKAEFSNDEGDFDFTDTADTLASTQTLSAGDCQGITELVLPNILPDVLRFIKPRLTPVEDLVPDDANEVFMPHMNPYTVMLPPLVRLALAPSGPLGGGNWEAALMLGLAYAYSGAGVLMGML